MFSPNRHTPMLHWQWMQVFAKSLLFHTHQKYYMSCLTASTLTDHDSFKQIRKHCKHPATVYNASVCNAFVWQL
ncbi:hypothetical protein AB205_0163350 [Aquarana catesbeiana]|uniref:Uncharacterized protein n=1 Tax=Aquarana catesbeiana TaxID=8400 RepID=A0A2G9NS12_AQUCT|nr:hypothetical protein AB205_0163350 [Aquarana catesbeiana]